MQSILFIINAPAYGSERMASALRMACALASQESETIVLRLFMISDAVTVALPNQSGLDNGGGLQSMVEFLIQQGAQIHVCRTCIQARGLVGLELIPGVTPGTMSELAEWTLVADKVISF